MEESQHVGNTPDSFWNMGCLPTKLATHPSGRIHVLPVKLLSKTDNLTNLLQTKSYFHWKSSCEISCCCYSFFKVFWLKNLNPLLMVRISIFLMKSSPHLRTWHTTVRGNPGSGVGACGILRTTSRTSYRMFMSRKTSLSDCTETLGRESGWHSAWPTHEYMPDRIF